MDLPDPTRPRRAIDDLDWAPGRPVFEEPVPVVAPEPPRVRRPAILPYAAVAAASALLGGLAAGAIVATLGGEDEAASTPPAATTPAAAAAFEQPSSLPEVVARARPSVIKIESVRRAQNGGTEQDVGSGVVIDDQGHILTNAHVVLGTESLKVILSDGTERPALLVGHDAPFTDVAVLQVSPTGLAPIRVGDSSGVQLGGTVVAIGNPLAEFEGSVSSGIISGLNRKRVFDGVRQDDLIQTDAALNNGNSGGALLNLNGELIGIPTAVLRQTRASQPVEGIGFAIPSNRAVDVARRIIASGGAIARPSLGLDHADISQDVISRSSRVVADQGALVTAVFPGGPAQAAGIAPTDVITKVGNTDVNREMPLLNALLPYSPGDSVRVVLNRAGRIIEVEVRLVRRN